MTEVNQDGYRDYRFSKEDDDAVLGSEVRRLVKDFYDIAARLKQLGAPRFWTYEFRQWADEMAGKVKKGKE